MTQASQETQTSGGIDQRLGRHGKVSYIEIAAADVERSAAFYQKVFGWSVQRRGEGNAAFDDGDLIGHWVTGREPASEHGVMLYISVDRIDDTLAEIRAESCEVAREPYPEGDLWVATFRDPAGNLMGIWQAGPR